MPDKHNYSNWWETYTIFAWEHVLIEADSVAFFNRNL